MTLIYFYYFSLSFVSFNLKSLQSPSPVCMFYFAHPFGGIATPSTITYSIDPHRDIPVKASNGASSISKSKNLSWCQRRNNNFTVSSTATTQSQYIEMHLPRTFQPKLYDEFTQSLILALQQRFGKFNAFTFQVQSEKIEILHDFCP